jgi:hypothetical protein
MADEKKIIIADNDRVKAADVQPGDDVKGPPILEVDTAFIVFRTRQGDIQVTGDMNAAIVADRQPSRDDVRGHCAVVIQDFGTQDTAALTSDMTIGKLMAAQQQAMQQAQAQAAMQAIGDPTKVPPGLLRGRR